MGALFQLLEACPGSEPHCPLRDLWPHVAVSSQTGCVHLSSAYSLHKRMSATSFRICCVDDVLSSITFWIYRVNQKYILHINFTRFCLLCVVTRKCAFVHVARVAFSWTALPGHTETRERDHVPGKMGGREPPPVPEGSRGSVPPATPLRPSQQLRKQIQTLRVTHRESKAQESGKLARGHTSGTRHSRGSQACLRRQSWRLWEQAMAGAGHTDTYAARHAALSGWEVHCRSASWGLRLCGPQ